VSFFETQCRNFHTCCWPSFSSFSNSMPLRDSLSGPNKWELLGTNSGLYYWRGNNSQPISTIFSTVWLILCGENHCHVGEWQLSAENLVTFCKLLVVIDHTITYSKSAFTLCPWDIKSTRTTSCLSEKTQAISCPQMNFLGHDEDICFHRTVTIYFLAYND